MTDIAEIYKKCKEIADRYELQIMLPKGPLLAPCSNLHQCEIAIIDPIVDLSDQVE